MLHASKLFPRKFYRVHFHSPRPSAAHIFWGLGNKWREEFERKFKKEVLEKEENNRVWSNWVGVVRELGEEFGKGSGKWIL
jgi:hypothetical protein